MKTKRCYRQGVIKKTINDDLKKGQIVHIIMEDKKYFFVKKDLSCIETKIDKKNLIM